MDYGIDLAVVNLSQSELMLTVCILLLVTRRLFQRPCSILAGAVEAGSSVGSGGASGDASRAGVSSEGRRRRSGVLRAKVIVVPPLGLACEPRWRTRDHYTIILIALSLAGSDWSSCCFFRLISRLFSNLSTRHRPPCGLIVSLFS
jgi:hypothetical protein